MKIYVITAGCYSDYHICAVTDNKVSADNLKKLYSDYEEANIEVYDTTQMPDPPRSYWRVYVDFYGKVESCEQLYFVDVEPDNMYEVTISLNSFGINVFADDDEHAQKIAFDKIAEYKYEHIDEFEKAKSEWERYMSIGRFNIPPVNMASSSTIII